MKLAIFFISSSRRSFRKLLSVSECSIKIKIRSHRALFLILLTSAIFYKQRLLYGNGIVQYLQNCNATTLTKTILERAYEDLQGSRKGAIFKQPIQFSKAIQF